MCYLQLRLVAVSLFQQREPRPFHVVIFVKFITSWSFRDLDAVVRSAAIPDATILGGGVLGSGLLSIVIRFLSLVQLPSLFHSDAELSCLGEHMRTAAASACLAMTC